jgi:hypothetical protein
LLLAIIALALHPHIMGQPAPQAELREMVTLSSRDRLVHGTLLLLLGVLLTWLASYALHRGMTRRPVLVGLVSFAIGICSLFAAGLVDGFILPTLAAQFDAASPAAQVAVVVTLAASSVAVNVLTVFGIVAMAIAIAAWSLDLACDQGGNRVAGLLGFVAAALSVAVLMMGGPSLKPHALMAVVCAQGVWYLWIAVLRARQASLLADHTGRLAN